MGIFDLFKSNKEHRLKTQKEYANVLILYNQLRSNSKKDLKGKQAMLEEIINFLNDTDKDLFHKLALENSRIEYSGYNTQFGWFAKNWNVAEKLLEDYKKEYNSNTFRLKRLSEFEDNIKQVEVHNISYSSCELKKQKLAEMDEIVTAKVGKQFNKEKLFKYVVIDVETTGLKASKDEIIELSAVKYIDYEPVEYFSTLIKPKKEIPDEITKINSITNDMVENAPLLDEVITDFDEFVKGFNIVGYNISFDLKFLYCNGSNILNQKGIKIYDVCELVKKAYKDLYSYSLDSVCEDLLNLYRQDAHRSLSDCFATDYVFCLSIDEIINS